MTSPEKNSFKARSTLRVGDRTYTYYSLPAAQENGLGDISRLPFSLKVILENLLRNEDGRTVLIDDIRAMSAWLADRSVDREIAYRPARVLMQDFTGVPAVVDLAAMRDAIRDLGGDPKRINPLAPVDLVIDHSVMVDEFATPDAFRHNVENEYRRNRERYEFLKWGQGAFDNFRVVPPGTGICHQVNLEFLARTIWSSSDADGDPVAFPDTLVGTDSHTTMVNGLAVLGWGVGGIEAEAAMLGQPISMLVPQVVGFELTGRLKPGVTATDLVLTVTQMLRERGVVGKFVEFFGEGLDALPLAHRATIANMAPEYGATCGFFPIDKETLRYLRMTGRSDEQIELVEAYAQAQGMWRDPDTPAPLFSDTLSLDMGDVEASLAGPKRPQDRVPLSAAAPMFADVLARDFGKADAGDTRIPVADGDHDLRHGDVVIAAITSCTNTSNPHVLVAAGLVARKARALGLQRKPWVKTSLAPGSQVVSEYLGASGLQDDLDALGFNLVGYGCTTCIGNSGPLPEPVMKAIGEGDLVVTSVLSGNRNFEGRINPHVKANYLASPPLVVAYALAGSMARDITSEPIGRDRNGNPVHLRDIWPSEDEIREIVEATVTRQAFQTRYADVFSGDDNWHAVKSGTGLTFDWNMNSTYVQKPPYFEGMTLSTEGTIRDVESARILALLGDSITTDHISPAGSFSEDTPAGRYLVSHQVPRREFNSYGARRGNHEVMMRGTFANIRIRNELAPGTEGGLTTHLPSGERMSIYDAAMRYKAEGTPLVVIAGREYGTGSSRDWAAKGTYLLGVRAVIAESFERIHRSNLVGMGVIPLQFEAGTTRRTLGLTGHEIVTLRGLSDLAPRQTVKAEFVLEDGTRRQVPLLCRIDTANEIDYVKAGGILHYVLRNLIAGD